MNLNGKLFYLFLCGSARDPFEANDYKAAVSFHPMMMT